MGAGGERNIFRRHVIRTRNRELMLPLLLLPISIPAVVAMVTATTDVLTGELSA